MVVLGIDPGYAIVGYGIVGHEGASYKALGSGAILTDADTPFEDRLKTIYEAMNEIIEKVKPQAISIESLYFQNNQKTAIKVAEARGVILLCARMAEIPVFEYTPLQVKTAVTGYGKAKKPQVMEMTKRLLKLQKMPRFDDTCDALAVAICHIHANGTGARRLLSRQIGITQK
ncbi:MAG: crossover junction endodeoxyribonuclease RuvC [Eubacteriales bacterium]|nr:crossover junction endodeoxyribonuclease RuvC [Eubacteriales bacterium]